MNVLPHTAFRLAPSAYWDDPSLADAPFGDPRRAAVSELVRETFLDLVTAAGSDLCLEIGAHEGTFTKNVSARLPAARCVAFEANPYVFARYFARLSAIDNVEYVHAAVGREGGLTELHIPRMHQGRELPKGNRTASLLVHARTTESEVVAVPSVALDDVFESSSSGETASVWMDVEGALGEVFTGGSKFFARVALLYVELYRRSPWRGQMSELDAYEFLGERGLRPLLRDCERPQLYNVILGRDGAVPDSVLERCGRQIAARIGEILRTGSG
jgi:FkbM family methyltransferase